MYLSVNAAHTTFLRKVTLTAEDVVADCSLDYLYPFAICACLHLFLFSEVLYQFFLSIEQLLYK